MKRTNISIRPDAHALLSNMAKADNVTLALKMDQIIYNAAGVKMRKDPLRDPNHIGSKEAAAILGIQRRSVDAMATRGTLPFKELPDVYGNTRRVFMRDVIEGLAKERGKA